MGLFSKTEEPASVGPAGGDKDLTKKKTRQICWDSRDKFFACLDKNNIVDAIKDSEQATAKCPKEEKQYEADCIASWIDYFKQKRTMEYNKEQMLKKFEEQGAVKVEPNVSFK
ncbi:Cytochrome c oxidase assembly factor 6 [Yarrowia sp. C11]|nr:Cytochrome c oxidase assembly factor 6 [Yarrowia sp. E02]KAG5372220.1 Cytochrome c oxidase assembly factor 6 [Yarrowia sp. C11]